MTIPRPLDRKTFLANLRRSKLLTERQLADALRRLPRTDRGATVARHLVEQELLTHFQAERLLAGRNTGFHLGQYRILDQLGRGGMGRVFKAEHRTLKRVVALKVLAPRLLQSDRARALFLREVQAAAQLVHPNVVAAFDAAEENGRCFLVLEYVDGPNLDQLVRKQGPLPIGLACDYVKQTAHGLSAAHGLGMVHRDIKPANLLVQRRGSHDDTPGLIKISDFGLARLQNRRGGAAQREHAGTILTQQHVVMGTPDFLSPEQARDVHRADVRSDLYSLGCTFYYLLTGQTPFAGGSALEKLVRHSSEKPVPVGALRSDVPGEVCSIVWRLLAKSADDRYQTPADLIAALEPFAVSGPTPWAPPSSHPELEAVRPSNDALPATASILEGRSSEEWSALTSTTPSAPAPTLANAPDRASRRRDKPRSRTLWLWLTAAAATLLAALAVVMALNS